MEPRGKFQNNQLFIPHNPGAKACTQFSVGKAKYKGHVSHYNVCCFKTGENLYTKKKNADWSTFLDLKTGFMTLILE